MKQAIIRFDDYVIALLQRLPVAVTPVFEFATWAASGWQLTTTAAALAAMAAWFGHNNIALAMAACLAATAAINLLKLTLRRPRPVTAYVMKFNLVTNYSFPSGHSAGSLLVHGLMACLAATFLPAPWGALVSAALAILVGLIGLSRIYLGAHFPTDVLGGWLLGGLSLWLIVSQLGL